MVTSLLYILGILILVADTKYWGLSTLGLMIIFIASLAHKD